MSQRRAMLGDVDGSWLWRRLFPSACVGCGRAAEGVCGACLARARPARPAPPPPGLVAWYSAFAYEGVIREAVARLKYRNQRVVLVGLAAALHARLPRGLSVDAVTWPPTTTDRRRARGFDHAALLARELARRLHVPSVRLLERVDQIAQTGLGVAGRRAGPVFRARPGGPLRCVLLVDDVATTGATLAAAAAALGSSERCKWVIGATLARTSLKDEGSGTETASGRAERAVHTPTAEHEEYSMQTPATPGSPSLRRTQRSPRSGMPRHHGPIAASDSIDVRRDVVRRIGTELAAGTYNPPVSVVVDCLIDALRSSR